MARKQKQPGTVRVRVLGATELQIGTRRVGMNTEALFALALYLTTRAGERIAREEILEVFWTEGAEENRRHAMRQMMYRLRQLGLALDEEGEFLRLDPARVESDLRDCLQLDWPERASTAAVEAALALGPTFSARLAAPFLDWFDGVRAEVAARHRKAAQKQITQARREGRWSDVEHWSVAVLRTDPLNEEATLARAESAAMSGSKVAALEILDTYLAEIGQVAPELGKPAVVLRKRIAEKRADWSLKGPREVALIGRTDLVRRLNALVDSVIGGNSNHQILEGPPGSGKSRVLSEAAKYAQLRGLRVLSLRAEQVMQEHPLAFARELAALMIELPGAAAVAPDYMTVAVNMAEEAVQLRADPLRLSQQISPSSIAAALTGMISAVGLETRFLIVLDDLQWADKLSLHILAELLRSTSHTRVGVLAATRPISNGAELKTVSRSFDQHHRVTPLSDEAAAQLALATAIAHNRTVDNGALADIVRTAGGNPLFVKELTIARTSFSEPKALPDSLSQIVETRLATLGPHEQRLLRISALLGDIATVARVRASSSLSHAELQAALATLELEAMIRLSPERTLCVHDCWSEVLLQHTPASLLAALALECSEQLLTDPAARSHSIQRRTGHLLRIAGENDRALEYLLASSDSLYAIGLPHEAMESLSSFRTLAEHPTAQARLRYRAARNFVIMGDPEAAITIIEDLRRSGLLRQQGLWHEHLSATIVLCEAYIRTEKVDSAPTDELLLLAMHEGLSAADQQSACLVGVRIASNRADYNLLAEFASRSRALDGQRANSYAGWMTALVHATECGSAQEIAGVIDRASQIDRVALTVPQRCLMQRFLGQALRVGGQFERAVDQTKAAHDLAAEHGLHHYARVAAELAAYVCLDYEDLSGAREWIAKSSRLSNEAAIATTVRSHEHALDRLSIQEGDFSTVCSRVLARLRASKSPGTAQARLGELALAALCLSKLGHKAEAEIMISETVTALHPILGQYSSHFSVELTARSLQTLGHTDSAAALVRNHMQARVAQNPPKLPPFFAQLASAEVN